MSVPQNDESLYKEFEDCLFEDLTRSVLEIGSRRIKSVFFGGGTPSLMNPKAIEKILDFLFKNHQIDDNVEITLEANPATFDKNKIEAFRTSGINRLSLGIQSFLDKNLRFLGRIYDGKQAIEAAEIVSKTFENLSFDFMYGYESQTLEDLKLDLVRAANFGCPHISCYQLTFEENAPFYRKALSGKIKRISESKELELFDLTESVLKDCGIFRYEISNYAKPGFESRHNLAYWNYDDYLGVGPSAHSRVSFGKDKKEMIKISDPFLWKAAIDQSKMTFSQTNILTEEEKLTEIIIMGLRLVNGITIDDLYKKISPKIVDRIVSKEKLKFLREKKLIEDETRSKIQPTKSGLKKADSIVEFLLEK
jgi:oxygen-independent coproporphyrinogen-3 oxidase